MSSQASAGEQTSCLADRDALEIALEAADLGIWDWDLSTNQFVYSDRAKTICGFPLDKPVTFEDVVAVTHPEDYPFTIAQAQRAMDPAIRASAPFEYRLLRPDGSVRWVSAHGRVIFETIEGAPKAVRYVGTLQDITERHTAEARLLESEARFRAMADSTPAPAWVTDEAGKIVFANQAFAEIAGVSADALTGDAWIGLLHPDDLAGVASIRAQAWQEGHTPYRFEARFKNPNGGWYWMAVSARPRFRDGAFQGYVGIAIDITAERRVEEELRASERRLRLAMESSNTADWSWDAETDTLKLSPAASAMLGLPASFSWRQLNEAMNEANGRALADTAAAAIEARGSWEVELHITRPSDQTRLWIAARGQALFDGERLTGMVGLISDISARKEREEAERLLVREVDHRAKNVLAVVQALARLAPFETHEQYKSDLLGRISALGRAHGLLSHSRWSGVDLSQLLQQALEPLGEDRRRVELVGPSVMLDAHVVQPLSLILHELVTNAIKYGALKQSGGTISIGWRLLKECRVAVEWREQAPSPAPAPEHHGFGVTLIDGAAKQIDGKVERRWEEAGLFARIEFVGGKPGARSPAQAQSQPQSQAAALSPVAGLSVLLVDDEPLIALDLKDMLEAGGAQVIGPVHNLSDACVAAEAGGFDCALLDVNLGGDHIGPVLEILRRRAIPFALVTGYETPGIDAPALAKPFKREAVLSLVSRLARGID